MENSILPLTEPRKASQNFALFLILIWFTIGGVTHFTHSELFVQIVPPSLPGKLWIVWFTGVCELLAVIGLLIPKWRRATGWWLIVFSVCVWPANIYMWLEAEQFAPMSEVFLLLRVPLQIVLIWMIWHAAIRVRKTDSWGSALA